MMNEYDIAVIGSGFGGAITACKLARRGYRVCILERGSQWTGRYFPGDTEKKPIENLVDILCYSRIRGRGWSVQGILEKIQTIMKLPDPFNLIERPKKPFLWDYMVLGKMHVLTASGVGGGSLVYANVLHRAHREAFDEWPNSVNWYEELQRHYDEVESVIGTTTAKDALGEAKFDKARALKKASEASAKGKWNLVNLAINRIHPNLAKFPGLSCDSCHAGNVPPEEKGDCETENEELCCMACGRCVLGCKRQNKHTLDLNYIKDAITRYGAHLYPNHEVTKIELLNEGPYNYLVLCDEQQRAFKAKKVVVAAGSIGSTELLLKCKNKWKSLSGISDKLGHKFSGNGDFQGFAYDCNVSVDSSNGPTITSGVDFNPGGKRIVVEEGGIPEVLAPLARVSIPLMAIKAPIGFVDVIKKLLENRLGEDVTKNTLMYLCMERVGAYGKIELSDDGDININWDEDWERLEGYTNELVSELETLTRGIGGIYFSNPLWERLKTLVTVHPIGGCPMGDTIEKGVVKPNGEVFGYDNLYVADGSIIPASLGVNPSLTIGALASRIADLIPPQKG